MSNQLVLANVVEDWRARVDTFLVRHLTLKECLELQKKHLLTDLLLHPLNALWTVPYLMMRKPLDILDQIGWERARPILLKIPPTFKTRYQREIEDVIARELLKLDKEDRLAPGFVREAYVEITAHASRQAGVTDLASSAATYLAAYFLVGDSSLNAFGLGRKIAALWAKDDAASSFFLGKSLGKAYYNIAPPEPSTWHILVSMTLILAGLAVLSTAAAVSIAPLQNKLGFHRQSLARMINAIVDRFILKATKDGASLSP